MFYFYHVWKLFCENCSVLLHETVKYWVLSPSHCLAAIKQFKCDVFVSENGHLQIRWWELWLVKFCVCITYFKLRFAIVLLSGVTVDMICCIWHVFGYYLLLIVSFAMVYEPVNCYNALYANCIGSDVLHNSHALYLH